MPRQLRDHKLSIDYRIRNQGPGSALATKVTGATATRGVFPLSEMPITVGYIAQGAYAPVLHPLRRGQLHDHRLRHLQERRRRRLLLSREEGVNST